MTTVAVSILSFNSSAQTIACVEKLLSVSKQADQIIQMELFVADNGSSEQEQRLLVDSLNQLSRVHYIQHSQNIGFAAGHNHNIKRILQHAAADYIWLLNNDCLVDANTLSELLKSATARPDVGIWGATILEVDGMTIQCAGGCFYSTWSSAFRQYGQGKPKTQLNDLRERQFDYLAGASLFFPAEVLRTGLQKPAGSEQLSPWLNEAFFLYFEELDLARRLQPEYTMGWSKNAIITHIGGSSTGTTGDNRSEAAEYHSSLSALKFTRIYYPGRLWVVAPVRYILKCLQLGIKGRFRLLVPLTRAYRDFWFT